VTPPSVEERRYVLSGYGATRTTAVVRVVTYQRPARIRRAAAALAVAWAAALVSVFIPLAHFVLVPGFLVAGLVAFRARLGAQDVAIDGRGTCPDCGQEQALDVKGRWQVPRAVTCRACQRGLTIGAASG